MLSDSNYYGNNDIRLAAVLPQKLSIFTNLCWVVVFLHQYFGDIPTKRKGWKYLKPTKINVCIFETTNKQRAIPYRKRRSFPFVGE